MTQGRFRLGYRPELDGLRGVAVLAVVLFHGLNMLHAPWGVGGYLGVDVFFVLSGFLITTLLLEEWNSRGEINLPYFYGRRVCRLFPALAVVVGCVTFIAAVLMRVPGGMPQAHLLWAAIVSTLAYVENWAEAFEILPLHYLSMCWTLAIEEQFYLVWPLALLLALRRGWSSPRLARLMLGGFGLVSLWRAVLMLSGAHWIRLEGTDAASGGLLIGCAVALMLASGGLPHPSRRLWLGFWFAAGALVLLIAAAHSPVAVPPAPGLVSMVRQLAIVPLADVATAALLLGLLVLPRTPLHTAFQFAPLAWFGRISYGLYLWHPFLLWFVPHTPGWLVIWFVLSVGIAAASYYGLERRIVRIGQRFRVAAPATRPILATGDD